MKIKLLFRPFSFWIGIHHSTVNNRTCINIIPFFTIRLDHKTKNKFIDRRDNVLH